MSQRNVARPGASASSSIAETTGSMRMGALPSNVDMRAHLAEVLPVRSIAKIFASRRNLAPQALVSIGYLATLENRRQTTLSPTMAEGLGPLFSNVPPRVAE